MPTNSSLSKSLILLLAATSALGPAAMQILLPALPVIKDTFRVSDDVAQLTLSLSMLAIAVGTLHLCQMNWAKIKSNMIFHSKSVE